MRCGSSSSRGVDAAGGAETVWPTWILSGFLVSPSQLPGPPDQRASVNQSINLLASALDDVTKGVNPSPRSVTRSVSAGGGS